MKDRKKRKLAGSIGVVWMLVIHVRGEKAKIRKAFLLSSKRKVRPIKKIQRVLINFIVNSEGQNFNRIEIRNG